jgi:hypothetical protein
MTCGVVVVELRGFEPLTPCMPYTDLRPYHGRIRGRVPLSGGNEGVVVNLSDGARAGR